MNYIARKYRAWGVVACVLVCLGTTSVLGSEGSDATTVAADGTSFWDSPQASSGERMPLEMQHRIAGSVLRPRDSAPSYSSITAGCIYAESDEYTVWNAPVYLPQGATVDDVRFYFFDGSVSTDSIAWFTVLSGMYVV